MAGIENMGVLAATDGALESAGGAKPVKTES